MKKDTTWIKYDGNSYNATVLGKMTKDEFVAHEKHNFEGNDEGINELYELIQKRIAPKPEAPAPITKPQTGKAAPTEQPVK